MEPLFLTPYFRPKIWGGRKLKDIFNYDIPEGKVAKPGLFLVIKTMLPLLLRAHLKVSH